jgi:carbon-monoxide dehydrogenase large subunit
VYEVSATRRVTSDDAMSIALTQQITKLVGQRVRAVEAPRVLMGTTRYVDDLKLPAMLYLSFARSSSAHARLLSIDTSNALKRDGVISVFQGRDVKDEISPFPLFAAPPGVRSVSLLPVAVEKTRYAGEIVAGVVAKDRYLAEDAIEDVSVDYDTLEPILDPERAIDANGSVIDEWGTNLAYSSEIKKGKVEESFSSADLVLKETFRVQRQYGSPMEPRGVVADYDRASKKLTLWSSTQWAHIVRSALSRMLRIGEHRIRVITPDVGGGFGNKQDVYPEEVLAAYAAMKVGRPVKWTASRSEDITSTVHARDQIHHVEVAADKSGKIVAVKDHIIADLGAFHTLSIGPQLLSVASLPGPYRIRNWHIRLDCVTTNKTPVGAYRGFGQSEANFVMERALDLISRELKLDPVSVRLQNLVQPNELPYRTALDSTYDSGNYPEALRRALKLSGYEKFRAAGRSGRDSLRRGIGISFCLESTGVGPSKQMAKDGYRLYSGYDSATVRVERSGNVTVLVGLSPHGQGADTTLAQVCADQFGISLDSVSVSHGDTESAPYGFGTWGSRTAMIGSAVVIASATKVIEKAKRLAARALEVSDRDVELIGGNFSSKRSGGRRRSLSLADVAELAYDGHDLPAGMEPGLEATTFYDPPSVAFSYQVHIPVVEVDTESGRVKLVNYYVVHDCGTVINPNIVEGQVHGGIAQGIAGALLEEIAYDRDGQLLSPTFIDYLLPTSGDVPPVVIEHMETKTPFNPLGVKGMGEGGAIAPPAAIASAVDDALEEYGVRITRTPISPEMLHSVLTAAKLARNKKKKK